MYRSGDLMHTNVILRGVHRRSVEFEGWFFLEVVFWHSITGMWKLRRMAWSIARRKKICRAPEKKRTRVIMTPRNSSNLSCTEMRHGQVVVKWAFGRFPPLSSPLLEENFGEVVQEHLHTLTEDMQEYFLSEEKKQATEASLEQPLFFTASFFEDME